MCHHYSAQFVVHVNYSSNNNEDQIINNAEQKLSMSDLTSQLNKFTSNKPLKFTMSECLLDQVYESVIRSDENSYQNNGYVQTELNQNWSKRVT